MATLLALAATMMGLSGSPLTTFAFDSVPDARYVVLNMETGQTGPVHEFPDAAVVDDHVALIMGLLQRDPSLLASVARPATFYFVYAPFISTSPTAIAPVGGMDAPPAVASPWMTFQPTEHGADIFVHVSDHRVLADAVARQEGRIETVTPLFDDGALLTNACLNEFLGAYEEWAGDGRKGDVAERLVGSADCMPPGIYPGLLHAAKTARQVFLAPFGQSFMRRVDDIRAASRPFYRSLYSSLLRQGFERLGAAPPQADGGWWKTAAAQADRSE